MQSVSRPLALSSLSHPFPDITLTVETRYKPDVNLRFIAEELGFEGDSHAMEFITNYGGAHLLEQRGDSIAFLTGKAGSLFEAARAAAFRRIDIKGQI